MRSSIIALALSFALLSTAALADVPGLISYQGTLTDSAGVALDTTVAMTFSINSDSVGGDQVWTETQPSVTVSHGLFNVLLGSVNAIPDTVFKDPQRWLGVQVAGDLELAPRQRIASEGYALRAGDDGDWATSGGDIYRPAGRVGIGTSTPDYLLDVAGDVKTSGAVLVGANRLELDPGFVRGNLRFQSNQLVLYGGTSGIALHNASLNPVVTMLDNGNLGIGTTTPSYKLEVAGDLKSTGAVLVGDHRLELDPGWLRGNLRFQSNQLIFYGGTAGIALKNTGANTKVVMLDDGSVGIGTTSPSYTLDVEGDIECTQLHETSDERLKEDIEEIDNALEKINRLRGIYFRWKDPEHYPEGRQVGMIAQDVEEVVPEAVDKKGEYYSMATSSLVPLLIEAIKEQQEQIEALKARLENER